ncbi:MAG: hypothetical protein H6797_01965 [Candidatus Nomurabacteria bacterium]|nr:MAG: hypothetical protein H6797_01965 [Candidatus Nomurabacteria bacterium]
MATQKKTVSKKKTKVVKQSKKKSTKVTKSTAPFVEQAQKIITPHVVRAKNYLARRPHRSFRVTRRRDYKRSLQLPSYWSFTAVVWRTLWKNWRLFGGLAVVYIVATIVVSGVGQQESYNNLVSALKSSGGDLFKGDFGPISQAGLLLAASVSTGLAPNVTQAQSVIGALAVLFGWLASVWALRNVLAGHKPQLRDALYNSGSPVLATTLVSFVAIVQLLPAAIALIVYTAAQNSGLLDSGVSAMLVWMGISLLGILSLYWISSTFIALVIVTLPGMYPMRAIRAAGDLVVGRRLRLLYRLLWLIFVVIVAWLVIMIPIILFDDWVKKLVPAINWLPLVPLSIISLSSLTLIFTSSYIYLLYRRIVDDDASPA